MFNDAASEDGGGAAMARRAMAAAMQFVEIFHLHL
jgi:hypothetical protein